MNTNQLKRSSDWDAVRAQVVKCGSLVSSHDVTESVTYYRAKDQIRQEYAATEEVYQYLGLEWRFTVVKQAFTLTLSSGATVEYVPGEITVYGYKENH